MKLFRRLTGNAPRPDSWFGYLKYALGEIVLVVVGILIAVSLNNWNERRKDANALQQVFATVKADLEQDQEEIAQALAFYELRAPVFEQVLAGTLTAEDYRENKGYAFIMIGYPEVSLHDRGVELLEGFKGTIPPARRDLVARVIAFYTERTVEISVDDKLRADDFMANFWHFKNEMPWWADYIHHKEIEGFLPYALSDPDYRNRVATTQFIAYDVFVPELVKFQEQAEALLIEIDGVLSD